MQKIITVLTLALTCHISSALAESNLDFFVSGVLRSNADGMVIKLAHGVESASSANEAVGAFAREVVTQYPGYSLIDAIASPLRKQTEPCRNVTAI